jgi:hypothetical protein
MDLNVLQQFMYECGIECKTDMEFVKYNNEKLTRADNLLINGSPFVIRINSIQKINNLGWFEKIKTQDFWNRVIDLMEDPLDRSGLLRSGQYLCDRLKEPEECFICKKTMTKCITLACGCKFHGICVRKNIINYSFYSFSYNMYHKKKYSCPKCISAANKIKKQFKESYCCPDYKMCKSRLIRDYNEISAEFDSLSKY